MKIKTNKYLMMGIISSLILIVSSFSAGYSYFSNQKLLKTNPIIGAEYIVREKIKVNPFCEYVEIAIPLEIKDGYVKYEKRFENESLNGEGSMSIERFNSWFVLKKKRLKPTIETSPNFATISNNILEEDSNINIFYPGEYEFNCNIEDFEKLEDLICLVKEIKEK